MHSVENGQDCFEFAVSKKEAVGYIFYRLNKNDTPRLTTLSSKSELDIVFMNSYPILRDLRPIL